ncbi:MAG TPA: hypothetical protein VJU14_14040 [Solirubrobacterales bacterium]|nr:hypothetical protein [Solirubrobacterales bacterium]
MTATTKLTWTCGGCGVATSRSDAAEAPLPDAWEDCAEGTFCLGCRRRRVGEAALEAAPAAADRDDRMRLRRTAVIEFELLRSPEKTNGSIAKTCRSSIPVVAAARRQLDAAGG